MPQDPNDPLAVLVAYVAGVLVQDAFRPGDFTDDAMADFVQAGARLLAVANKRHLEARNAFDRTVDEHLEGAPPDASTDALRAGQSDEADMSNRLGLAARIEAYDALHEAVDRFRGGQHRALGDWAARWMPYFADEPGLAPPS